MMAVNREEIEDLEDQGHHDLSSYSLEHGDEDEVSGSLITRYSQNSDWRAAFIPSLTFFHAGMVQPGDIDISEATWIETDRDAFQSIVFEVDGLHALRQAIAESRWVLDLEDNWDGEGSTGVDASAFSRAEELILSQARQLLDTRGIAIEPPRISPGPDRSVDIHWEYPDRELAVNVPAEPGHISFYFTNHRGTWMKGEGDMGGIEPDLLTWLVN